MTCFTSVIKIPGDDHQALIWDIQQMPRPIEDPILAYTAAEGAINQVNKTD
jgi:WD repeat-containing protein 68